MRVVGFIEKALGAVQHQHMRIADVSVRPTRAVGGIAFNGCGGGIGSDHHIALACVVDYVDGHGGSGRGVDDYVRNTISAFGAKIRMKVLPCKIGRTYEDRKSTRLN